MGESNYSRLTANDQKQFVIVCNAKCILLQLIRIGGTCLMVIR